jgi:hypothetical protein
MMPLTFQRKDMAPDRGLVCFLYPLTMAQNGIGFVLFFFFHLKIISVESKLCAVLLMRRIC